MNYITKFYVIIYCILCGINGYTQHLLITEIMFDPAVSCPEYLEISNLENLDVPLYKMKLQKSTGSPVHLEFSSIWPSGECRLFTSDKEEFLRCYEGVDTGIVYQIPLFALTNSGTELIISLEEPVEKRIDETKYSPFDHNELFSDTKGISLERNILYPKSNKWRSGFVQFGYLSPGFLPVWNELSDIEISFSTTTVYTNRHQGSSKLDIIIETDEVDGSVSIEVFDVNGKKVHTIANAVPLQGGEIFTWNGRDRSGQLCPEGLYLFWIYYFDVEGRKRIYKKTCVLSAN